MRSNSTAIALLATDSPVTVKAPAPKAKLPKGASLTIALIAPAAWSFAQSKANMVRLVQTIGKNEAGLKAAQSAFYRGYVAYRLDPTAQALTPEAMALADKALAAGGIGKAKLAKGQSRRTKAEEQAYATARKAWHVIKETAFPSAPKAKGAKVTGSTDKAKGDAKADTSPQVTPKAKDKQEVNKYGLIVAATLRQYANKNAAVMSGTQADAFTKASAMLAEACKAN